MYVMQRRIIYTLVYYVVCSRGRFIGLVRWMVMFSSQKTLVLRIKRRVHVLIYAAWQQTF